MTMQFKSMKKDMRTNDKLDLLSQVTAALLDEVRSLKPHQAVDVKRGVDFQEEMVRFEKYLLERALEQTGGHQMRAAQLLNLKYTTFHEKLKRFHISLRPGKFEQR